jgi:myo-inositol-1(or 4)-monophosphatase
MSAMTEIEFIELTLHRMGPYVRERYGQRRHVDTGHKGDPNDLVTEVDVTVQKRVQEQVAVTFPGDLFVGEEEGLGSTAGGAPSRAWVIDPIDGTANFVRGLYPTFGISLAFARDGEVTAAGVLFPLTHDLFLAERGAGATRNGEPLACSAVDALGEASVEMDFGRTDRRAPLVEYAEAIIRQAGQLRCHGAAVVGLCAIATGDADGFIHANLQPWDYAASMLIVEEAGGRVTRWDGSPLKVFGGIHDIVATNGRFHPEMLGALT